MVDDGVQISKATKCSECDYTVIAKSWMHLMDGKLYCAKCAKIKREEAKEWATRPKPGT